MKSVDIQSGDEAGTQKVIVLADGSEEITKEDAVASLGDKASRYVVHTWEKEKAES